MPANSPCGVCLYLTPNNSHIWATFNLQFSSHLEIISLCSANLKSASLIISLSLCLNVWRMFWKFFSKSNGVVRRFLLQAVGSGSGDSMLSFSDEASPWAICWSIFSFCRMFIMSVLSLLGLGCCCCCVVPQFISCSFRMKPPLSETVKISVNIPSTRLSAKSADRMLVHWVLSTSAPVFWMTSTLRELLTSFWKKIE